MVPRRAPEPDDEDDRRARSPSREHAHCGRNRRFRQRSGRPFVAYRYREPPPTETLRSAPTTPSPSQPPDRGTLRLLGCQRRRDRGSHVRSNRAPPIADPPDVPRTAWRIRMRRGRRTTARAATEQPRLLPRWVCRSRPRPRRHRQPAARPGHPRQRGLPNQAQRCLAQNHPWRPGFDHSSNPNPMART